MKKLFSLVLILVSIVGCSSAQRSTKKNLNTSYVDKAEAYRQHSLQYEQNMQKFEQARQLHEQLENQTTEQNQLISATNIRNSTANNSTKPDATDGSSTSNA